MKVKRELTHHIPKKEAKRFRILDTFHKLEDLSIKKMKKKTGFNELNIPDISWMLRMLVYLDPNWKSEITKRVNNKYKKSKEKNWENIEIEVDEK